MRESAATAGGSAVGVVQHIAAWSSKRSAHYYGNGQGCNLAENGRNPFKQDCVAFSTDTKLLREIARKDPRLSALWFELDYGRENGDEGDRVAILRLLLSAPPLRGGRRSPRR